jgi:hypothetical protein
MFMSASLFDEGHDTQGIPACQYGVYHFQGKFLAGSILLLFQQSEIVEGMDVEVTLE